jgi:isopenicillin N synthase-like dioxygenase
MCEYAFRTFDLGRFEKAMPSERTRLGAEVDDICRTTGFLAIVQHGVPQEKIDAVWLEAKAFFDLPPDEKLKVRAPRKGYPYGYLGPEREALARSRGVDTPPDLKESFNGGPSKAPAHITDVDALAFCYAETIWPDRPQFRAAWMNYYTAMEDLAARLMRVFAVALQMPEHYFDAFIKYPVSALRALNYPEQHFAPRAGQLRAGAHTDYGSLTILLPQAVSKGLEILTPDGAWAPVPPIPGAFIVNIGDLMARWTNNRWVSTLHRVVNPPPDEGGLDRRQSLAFFHQPDWDAEIAVLPACVSAGDRPHYDSVRSGPYLMSKFRATTN